MPDDLQDVHPERQPIQAAAVPVLAGAVHQTPDVVRQIRAVIRQDLPVHPGRCASDASGAVLQEAATDGHQAHLVPAVADAQRSVGFAAVHPGPVSVRCR